MIKAISSSNRDIKKKYAQDKSLIVFIFYYIIDFLRAYYLTITFPIWKVVDYMDSKHRELQNKRAEKYYNKHAFNYGGRN